MKIGIDAKWFFSGNPSGKVVVRNLLEEFLKICAHHQVFIFLKKEERELLFPFNYPNVTLIYVWGKNNQISNLFCIRKVSKQLKLDVVLYFYYAPFITSVKRVVFIFDAIYISNPEYFTITERIYFSTMRFLATKADMILTISKTERTRLLKYKFNSINKIDVLYMGVHKRYKPQEFHSKEEVARVWAKYNLPERFILYIGRINARKNIFNLLRAISFMKEKKVKFVLGGKYDWKAFNLSALIDELNLKDKVDLLGYIDDNDLPVLYSLATIFCYVSYDEGFGLPPIEALSSGVPVVVSNSGSLPEICGDAGVYCNPNDPNDIAEKIDMLLSDENLYEQKKTMGIKVAQQYDWSKSAEKLLNIFTQVSQKE